MAARVIVFGPTGDVASVAARTAAKQGAKVYLAMRDVRKEIQGLTPEAERQGDFERVQADLMQPETVARAITSTGATSAFMYLAWGAKDHMRATFEAAQASGVNFLVFLSSFTIPARRALDEVETEHRIPYMHARAEIELRSIYGPQNFVALRPGAFAANTGRWRHEIQAGEIKLDNPETKYDYITPVDMGQVAGTILVNGQSGGQNTVYLYGPQLMAQKDAIKRVLDGLEKSYRILTEGQEGQHQPDASTSDVVVRLKSEVPPSGWFKNAYENHQEGVDNVAKYSGRDATSLEEWIRANLYRFKV